MGVCLYACERLCRTLCNLIFHLTATQLEMSPVCGCGREMATTGLVSLGVRRATGLDCGHAISVRRETRDMSCDIPRSIARMRCGLMWRMTHRKM